MKSKSHSYSTDKPLRPIRYLRCSQIIGIIDPFICDVRPVYNINAPMGVSSILCVLVLICCVYQSARAAGQIRRQLRPKFIQSLPQASPTPKVNTPDPTNKTLPSNSPTLTKLQFNCDAWNTWTTATSTSEDPFQPSQNSGKVSIQTPMLQIPYCKTPTNESWLACQQCFDSFALIEDGTACQLSSINLTKTTDCPADTYPSGQDCRQFGVNCLTYDSCGRCLTCPPATMLSDHRCILDETPRFPCEDAKCDSCTSLAKQVRPGYCQMIDPKCLAFDQKTGYCLKCQKGYGLREGLVCWPLSDPNFAYVDLNCKEWTEQKCKECQKGWKATSEGPCEKVVLPSNGVSPSNKVTMPQQQSQQPPTAINKIPSLRTLANSKVRGEVSPPEKSNPPPENNSKGSLGSSKNIYRYHASQKDGWRHMYSDITDAGNGWILDKGVSFKTPFNGSEPYAIPVYRYYFDQTKTQGGWRYLYSTDPNQSAVGWTPNGIGFFAYGQARPNTVPIYEYRVLQSDGARFLLSQSENCKGWEKTGVAFWAYPGEGDPLC